jgi:hypothetical protein
VSLLLVLWVVGTLQEAVSERRMAGGILVGVDHEGELGDYRCGIPGFGIVEDEESCLERGERHGEERCTR